MIHELAAYLELPELYRVYLTLAKTEIGNKESNNILQTLRAIDAELSILTFDTTIYTMNNNVLRKQQLILQDPKRDHSKLLLPDIDEVWMEEFEEHVRTVVLKTMPAQVRLLFYRYQVHPSMKIRLVEYSLLQELLKHLGNLLRTNRDNTIGQQAVVPVAWVTPITLPPVEKYHLVLCMCYRLGLGGELNAEFMTQKVGSFWDPAKRMENWNALKLTVLDNPQTISLREALKELV